MISPAEADFLLSQHLFQPQSIKVDLMDSLGRVLAEPILADRPQPPFDRVMMDGIAISFKDWNDGVRAFKITGVQRAGEPAKSLESGCIEIMTGAVCPAGADCVVPYEQIAVESGVATIQVDAVLPFQNIHGRGKDCAEGELLLKPGIEIGPNHIAIAASMGYTQIAVLEPPKVIILSTGDELVDTSVNPLPHQIRRSNVFALQGILKKMGVNSDIGHLKDDWSSVLMELKHILPMYDVVLLSGGVSKGKYDLIPDALKSCGVQEVFHRIAQKPGKPMWFGAGNSTRVFAFPGNPVSTYLCAVRYFIPWWIRSMHHTFEPIRVVMGDSYEVKGNLTFFLQVQLKKNSSQWVAYPIAGNGSGDFANLGHADAFIQIDPTKKSIEPGMEFDAFII